MQLTARSAGAALGLLIAVSATGATPPDFTGHWRQQRDSGAQRRLDIEQNGQTLQVTTTITNSQGSRHIDVKYDIGGQETVYKGLDGDEFHSSVHWDNSALVFQTVEHEGGKEIPETTVWTLSEDGKSLQVKRESIKSGETRASSATYARQP